MYIENTYVYYTYIVYSIYVPTYLQWVMPVYHTHIVCTCVCIVCMVLVVVSYGVYLVVMYVHMYIVY